MTISDHITLDEFWPYQVTVLADQISRYTLNLVRAKAGLNLSQWRVLAAVAEKPGRTAAQVTAITPMDKTIVSRAVGSLIKDGLIRKTAHASDKRRSSLTTTAKGLRVYKLIAADLTEAMQGASADLVLRESFLDSLNIFNAYMKQISAHETK